ncbi:hypothetical protein HY496_01055 [Candidatus Woesearchaeota archaeon]|nr:hypothetical protein [Candidatus Woesearchaeota archaeon]
MKKLKPIFEPDEILCNMCGKKIQHLLSKKNAFIEDYIKIVHWFGYGSPHDGDKYEFEICEPCFFKELVGKLQIAPTITKG